ncbi:hypothetical protein COOONC_25542 [Cooperia oncophora]
MAEADKKSARSSGDCTSRGLVTHAMIIRRVAAYHLRFTDAESVLF